MFRSRPYKVISIHRSVSGTSVDLAPLGPAGRIDSSLAARRSVNVHSISLLEQNRGKAGALNVFLRYFKSRVAEWCDNTDIDSSRLQSLMAIVDARHMLVEPDIFWNEALPFFSGLRTGKSTKDYGGHSGSNLLCINVQYPQFFSNVTRDDFLDNKNSAYYTVWQTLRDGAKATTSSGTNAIW